MRAAWARNSSSRACQASGFGRDADRVACDLDEPLWSGHGLGEPGAVAAALGDALFEEGEEEVVLAAELRVDDALREAGGQRDRVERGAVVALVEERAVSGVEHLAAVLAADLSPVPTRCHTVGTVIPSVC